MATYYAFSTADIIRAGGSVTMTVPQAKGGPYRIRSDFPITLTLDGTVYGTLSADAESFLPNPWGCGTHLFNRGFTTMKIELVAGYGGAGLAEAQGFYGLCVIDDMDTEAVDPRLLAPHCYVFNEDTAPTQEGVVRADYLVAELHIQGKLPSEFYLAAVSVIRRDNALGNAHYGLLNGTSQVTCFRGANNGPTDALERENLWTVSGVGAYTVSFPFLKMPLASYLSQYAAETATIGLEFHELRTTHDYSQLQITMSGAVRW